MASSAPPTTFVIALAIELNPKERIAQQGLGRIWLCEGWGMTRTAMTTIAAITSFLAPTQPRTFLTASVIDVVFIIAYKRYEAFFSDFLTKILQCTFCAK